MQSNNIFTDGFCIHSNGDLKISSGNTFDPSVTVSMPSTANIQIPNSGFTSNPGLQDALTSNRYNLKITERLDDIIGGLRTPGSRYMPAYIKSDNIIRLSARNISGANLTKGHVHEINCQGNQSLTISNDAPINEVVIITNCRASFSNGARLEDAVFVTTNTDVRSITGPNGVQIGRNDN